MLLKRNLLTAGLVTLMAVSVQAVSLAGGPGHGGSKGFSGNMSKPTFNAPHVSKSVGNVMPQQSFKPHQFQSNNSMLQTGKFTPVQMPKNGNVGINPGKVDPLHKVGPIFDPKPTKVIKFPGNLGVGNVKPDFPIKPLPKPDFPIKPLPKPDFPIKPLPTPDFPIKPIKPIKPIDPPFGGGKTCGTGGYWGNGCGFGWNWGCGNWVFGNCGCGYWPGYFGSCAYPYPYYVYTPTYFCTTPVVEVVTVPTTVVLSETAVPLAAPAAKELDLAVKAVQVVEAANMTRGALYRVTIVNKGTMNLDVQTRVAALAIKDSRPTETTPRTIETLMGLKAGESTDVDVRMPVAANDLPRLLVAVEIPEGLKDSDEANNVAAGEVSQLPQLAAAQ